MKMNKQTYDQFHTMVKDLHELIEHLLGVDSFGFNGLNVLSKVLVIWDTDNSTGYYLGPLLESLQKECPKEFAEFKGKYEWYFDSNGWDNRKDYNELIKRGKQ